jgi:hypothetical protein
LNAARAPQLKAIVMLLTPLMKSVMCIIVLGLVMLSSQAGTQTRRHRTRVPLRKPFIDRELSGPVTLKSEWLELSQDEPLRVARDTHELALFPDPPIQMVRDPTGKRTLIPLDGRDAEIEAELVGSNGIRYRSAPGWSQRMTGNLKITSRSLDFKDLPKDVTFTKVRIKSSALYPVKKILWRCYNWHEVHH